MNADLRIRHKPCRTILGFARRKAGGTAEWSIPEKVSVLDPALPAPRPGAVMIPIPGDTRIRFRHTIFPDAYTPMPMQGRVALTCKKCAGQVIFDVSDVVMALGSGRRSIDIDVRRAPLR